MEEMEHEQKLKEKTKKKKKKVTCAEIIRFYLTAFFILLASFSSFAFLFLVPFVIDPAFSTIFAHFDEEPRTCVTVHSESAFGLSKCPWSSCREGCTKDVFRCTQIYVSYLKDVNNTILGQNYTDPDLFDVIEWDYERAKIFPNVKGCGYPPDVNCTVFNQMYSENGTTFPCYYSKIQPETALTYLNIEETKLSLIYAIAIPWGCFLSSVLYLLATYTGMSKPKELSVPDIAEEIVKSKSSKGESSYSLRSISKSISLGVNRLKKEQDEKGISVKSLDEILTPASLCQISRRGTALPPIKCQPMPRQQSCEYLVSDNDNDEDGRNPGH